MVKLSEIVRENKEEKPQDKPGLISEATKMKDNKDILSETKKVYEDVILCARPIMNEVARGMKVPGREFINIAEIILDQIRVESDTLLSMITIFASFGEGEDYLYSHSVNVSILAASLCLALGYEESKVIDLCASSLLHDIGMLKIPQKIRNKPSEFTKEEYAVIKKHPAYGLDLMTNIPDLPKSVAEIVYQHHEKIDGTGYPEGKKGVDIPTLPKIVAIIEIYEAATHPRFYRPDKKIPYEGVKEVVKESGTSFDPKLVKAFLNFITPYPMGSFVLINNNEIGRVVGINKDLPLRPIIDVFFDAEGRPPQNAKRIDLASSPILYIEKAIDDSRL